MKMSVSKEELTSLVSAAVKDALAAQPPVTPTSLECPDCHTTHQGVPAYLDHRVSEYMSKSLEGLTDQIKAVKIPTSAEILADCKDGICGIMEETYDIKKKGEVVEPVDPSGSFLDYQDEPEEA